MQCCPRLFQLRRTFFFIFLFLGSDFVYSQTVQDPGADLFRRLESIFPAIDSNQSERCRQQAPLMSNERFCGNFRSLVCQQNPSPRADPTGFIHTDYTARWADYLRGLEENVSSRVDGLMRNAQVINHARRNVFSGIQSNAHLKACLNRAIILASETKQRFFTDGHGAESRVKIQEYLRNVETTDVECPTRSDAALGTLLEMPQVKRLGEELTRDLQKPLSESLDRNWSRVERLFDRARDISLRLLNRRLVAETDVTRQAGIREIIERVGEVTLENCNPSAHGNQNLFNNTASYTPWRNEIEICPQFFLSCASEMCIMNALAHEFGHVFDPCQTSDRSPLPYKNFHSLLPQVTCISRRGNRFNIAFIGAAGFCNNRQLMEGFSDHHAADVMAEYIKEQNFSNPEEIRASIVNAAAASCGSPNYSADHTGYPGRDQRISFYEKSRSLMQLAGCPTDSLAVRNAQPSCLYPEPER